MRLDYITRETGCCISILTEPTEENLAKCHLQHQSPLFMLPAELRNEIYALVLQPSVDRRRAYLFTGTFSRPTPGKPVRLPISLLHTCRRVWLEANGFALQQAQPALWTYAQGLSTDREVRFRSTHDRVDYFRPDARPHDHSGPRVFFARFTPNKLRNLSRMRIFADMFWFQGDGMVNTRDWRGYFKPSLPWPRSVVVSLVEVCCNDLGGQVRHEFYRRTFLGKPFLAEFLDCLDSAGVEELIMEVEGARTLQKRYINVFVARLIRQSSTLHGWTLHDDKVIRGVSRRNLGVQDYSNSRYEQAAVPSDVTVEYDPRCYTRINNVRTLVWQKQNCSPASKEQGTRPCVTTHSKGEQQDTMSEDALSWAELAVPTWTKFLKARGTILTLVKRNDIT
jgi:hypothetical protein